MGIGIERLGIVDSAQELARRFAERHPSLKRRIFGMAPDYSNAKVALINVDVRTGERRIDRFIDPAPVRRTALVAIPKPAVPTPPPVRPFHWTQCREDFRAKEMHGPSGSCLRLRDILEIVAGQAGIEASRLTSDEQCQVVARPRQVSVLLACEFRDDLTYPQLGFLYNRHHTSIIHAKERAIAQMRRGDESMISLYERSKAEITADFFAQEREAA